MRRFFCSCVNAVSPGFLFDRLCCLVELFEVGLARSDCLPWFKTTNVALLLLPSVAIQPLNPLFPCLYIPITSPITSFKRFCCWQLRLQNLKTKIPSSSITKLPQILGPSRNHPHHLTTFIYFSFLPPHKPKSHGSVVAITPSVLKENQRRSRIRVPLMALVVPCQGISARMGNSPPCVCPSRSGMALLFGSTSDTRTVS